MGAACSGDEELHAPRLKRSIVAVQASRFKDEGEVAHSPQPVNQF